MVARSAAGFVPAEKPRIAIAMDGTLAAIHEPTRITIVDLPGCGAFAEVGIDPEAGSSEVAWVGAPPRLAVLSRYAAHSTVHLLDPHGPRTIAEIRLEAPMRLMATVGAYALAVGSLGAAVLTATDSALTPYQFPARAVPVAAGAAAAHFVVALSGAIEEWDPASRMPKRRLKLPKPSVLTALGGSDRVVWMTSQQDPTRIDVFPLVNRGQPKVHELPEPLTQITSHPRSDLLACVGADRGRLYVVDLDGRSQLRTLTTPGIDRVEAAGLVLGRMVAVLAAQAKRPLALIQLDGREHEVVVAVPKPAAQDPEPAPKKSSLYEPDLTAVTLQSHLPPETPESEAAVPTLAAETPAVTAATPVVIAAPATPPTPAAPSLFRAAPAFTQTPAPPKPVKAAPTVSLSERFSSWRDRQRLAQPRSVDPVSRPIDMRPPWREELAIWARGVLTGAVDRGGVPSHPSLNDVIVRFELDATLYPAIALLYGAHLAGDNGVAPIDVARVLDRNWDEALGRGELAGSLVAVYRDSRVRLAPAVQRALDQLPITTGTLVGQPGPIALLAACVVVASEQQPLGLVAEATLPAAGGAILAGYPDADPLELVIEARARGAVPMLRATADVIERLPPNVTAIFVVEDEALADHLELPRLA